MKHQIVKGSVADLAQREGMSVALASALTVKLVLLVDRSGSMGTFDATRTNGEPTTRLDAAQEQLSQLQRENEGKAYIIAFDSSPEPLPGGVLGRASGSTNLTDALLEAKKLTDAGLPLMIISDGEPDDEATPIHIVRDMAVPVSAIYIGHPGGRGEEYLRRLTGSAKQGTMYESEGVGLFLEAARKQLLLK